jgi:hypothetical protein
MRPNDVGTLKTVEPAFEFILLSKIGTRDELANTSACDARSLGEQSGGM